jgi:hypothetical protein
MPKPTAVYALSWATWMLTSVAPSIPLERLEHAAGVDDRDDESLPVRPGMARPGRSCGGQRRGDVVWTVVGSLLIRDSLDG